MRLFELVKARLRRRPFLLLAGPNEARVVFDAAISFSAAAATFIFHWFFLKSSKGIFLLPLYPIGLLLLNSLVGIYSSLRLSSGRIKALALAVSCMGAAVILGYTSGAYSFAAMWFMLTFPPLALARLLLALPYKKHKNLVTNTIRQRGKVLVLGGAGYIGSHLVDQLIKSGESVVVLDKLMYGRRPLEMFRFGRNLELVEGDVTDIGKLTEAMRGVSSVVHLAGLVGDPACAVDHQFTRHTNIIATRMARDVARSMGIYRFVFASSCSVYGTSEKEAREEDVLRPVSLYAQTKIDSERELLGDVPDDFYVTVMRFATVFGHSWRPRFDLVANLFTAQALTDGVITVTGPQQWRPFIHCRDLARAIVSVLKADPATVQSQIFNVGDSRLNMTILQLAEQIREIVSQVRPVTITTRDDAQDLRNYAVSFEKIRTLLGFQAETLLQPGISEIVQEFQKGTYENYRNEIYSNVAMTKRGVEDFRNPDNAEHLYAPLRFDNVV